jgi:hypothetical protein
MRWDIASLKIVAVFADVVKAVGSRFARLGFRFA